jgi:hypothetical protein
MKHEQINRNRKWIGAVVVGGFLLGAMLLLAGSLTPAIQANGPGHFQVMDRDSVAYGRTYSEWSAAWWQWALSIPTKSHPLFDNGDISVGQSGPVWFLGGKFCATGGTCSYTGVVRYENVPANTALYVAILNAEDSVLEDPAHPEITDLRSVVGPFIDAATVSMQVDGQAIQDLKERFRVQSPAFVFTIPDDNLFTAIGEGTFKAGSYFPAIDDAVYVMLAPLPPGHHKIYLSGSSEGFSLDVTYYLNVSH